MVLDFNAAALGTPDVRYVCWLDVMGTGSAMSRSLNQAANFVGKLHSALLEARPAKSVSLYPAVDGVYITAANYAPILSLLQRTFRLLAEEFLGQGDPAHRFMVRSAISFGRVVEHKGLMKAAPTLAAAEPYAERIILGPALTLAYRGESLAAPFGVYLDESARLFSPPGTQPLSGAHWRWWRWNHANNLEVLARDLGRSLDTYLAWCDERADMLLYRRDRIAVHRDLAHQYFMDV